MVNSQKAVAPITVTAGAYGRVTAGIGGTVAAGVGGTLTIVYFDIRPRLATAYVGLDGILPNVAYRLGNEYKFVPAGE